MFGVRELGRRPGAMRSYPRTIPAPDEPARLGLEGIYVPPGAAVELDVRLESVTEGVYVSGTARAPLAGECVRCLVPVTEPVVEDARRFLEAWGNG